MVTHEGNLKIESAIFSQFSATRRIFNVEQQIGEKDE